MLVTAVLQLVRMQRSRRAANLLFAALVAVLLSACMTPAVSTSPSAGTAAALRLTADTPALTPLGNTFVAPAEWTLSHRHAHTLLEAPEPGSRIAVVDLDAPDADGAATAAWRVFDPSMKRQLRVATPAGPRDGWTKRATLEYLTSPNEHRSVEAHVRRANGVWTVVLLDVANDVYEKRSAQIGVLFDRLLPKGYVRESFAGRHAHVLDAQRVAQLTQFVQRSMSATGVPGLALGLVQNGKVVFADGFGVRALGRAEKVDAQTLFLVASNTKAMVTLMLATLVDEKKLDWETPVAHAMPSFKLGDAAVTAKVRVKHLICACTGLPRQDLEWLFEFQDATAATAMQTLATMQPTSEFGKLYQYSNPMAAAAGYVGGHVAYPGVELGRAYDRAMQARVFEPLGMTSTTHDFDRAERGNAAAPHAPDVDGRMTSAVGQVNRSIIHVRPAGGAWSNIDDMLRYVSMELAEGLLPDGRRHVSRAALMARRAPQVHMSADVTYGMGLRTNTAYGTPLIHHGGSMIGFYSDMMWLPEHGVGAVILANGDPGWLIRAQFRRKLLEVLFDGRAEADESIDASAKAYYQSLAAERRRLQVPANTAAAQALAARYHHPAIGGIAVNTVDGRTMFDFGEWQSEMGSRVNPDGSISLLTIAPGFSDAEFVVGREDGRRTLTLRDGQNRYVLVEQPAR